MRKGASRCMQLPLEGAGAVMKRRGEEAHHTQIAGGGQNEIVTQPPKIKSGRRTAAGARGMSRAALVARWSAMVWQARRARNGSGQQRTNGFADGWIERAEQKAPRPSLGTLRTILVSECLCKMLQNRSSSANKGLEWALWIGM